MLQYKTITPPTLALLTELQSFDFLKDFYLVGGTALALQIGHRTSTDIDLFNHNAFDISSVRNELNLKYKPDVIRENKFGVFSFLNDIKTDIVFHPYKLIDNIILSDDIRMASSKEIAAMKLNAITRRGKKEILLTCLNFLNNLP